MKERGTAQHYHLNEDLFETKKWKFYFSFKNGLSFRLCSTQIKLDIS